MWIINSFLCFTLETGGKIIGWLGLIGSAIAIPLLILLMVGLSTLSCNNINQLSEKIDQGASLDLEIYDCRTIYGVIIIALTILIALYMFGFVIYFLLLRGISNQNHRQILPVVVVEAISLGGFVLFNLSKTTIQGFIEAIIVGFIHFYVLTALYSLYVKIRDGNRRGVPNVHFTKPPNQV